MSDSQDDRHILITGATDGIGLHLINRFSQLGYIVAGTGSRSQKNLPDEWPENALYIRADQSDPNVGDVIAKALGTNGWNRLDNLVLNAGTGWVGTATEESLDTMRQTLAVNLEAPMAITWQLTSLLEQSSDAQLTLIGSTARNGHPDFATYAASKAGLAGFARALTSEWQERIRVQLVDPGPTATQMHQKAGMKPSIIQRFFMSPEMVAERIFELITSGKPKASIGVLGLEAMRIRRTFQAGGT